MKIFETDNVIGALCLLFMEKVVCIEKNCMHEKFVCGSWEPRKNT